MVLFVTYFGGLGGAERDLIERASRLERSVVVASPLGPLADAAASAGLPVARLASRPLALRGGLRSAARAAAGMAGLARDIARLERSLRPEATVLWGMRTALAAAPLPAAVPRIFHHHDLLPGPRIGAAVRRAAARCDAVVVNSRAVGATLEPVSYEVISPGVDLERFRPTPLPAEARALTLGAIVPWKRPELALEAVALAAATLGDLRLVLAGAPLDAGNRDDGLLMAQLRDRAAREDLRHRVDLVGPIPDARAALSEASCLLHAADAEPFGLVLVEAMACGRPVVAARAGGPADIVVDGVTGRLFTPGDPNAAAAALVDVLSDPARTASLGAAARTRATEHYDAGRAAARFAAVVDSAAGRSSA
jgi:glycosyltransferase involved in cell wall biosynthesis